MDKIFISDLKIEAIIGIYDWERETKQIVSIDLEMATDIKKAAASDDIEDTINYKAISKHLIDFVGKSSYNLVETLAEEIANIVNNKFGVSWVKVVLHKPGALRGATDVGIIIERSTK